MQRIHTEDSAIESEIQAKGKTAPRVTPADIEAAIAREYFFTAGDGADIARIRAETPDEATSFCPASEDPDLSNTDLAPLRLLTFCVLVLRNGFTVTGESACASPENFDAEIGRKIARQNAAQKIWPLEGYLLKEKLAFVSIDGRPAAA
ncbi:Gp49 family protein [Massilia sp. DD77]|uniref:Gp49 family protein n=1 Tax=Massilia sp. DD77 TaxID=3109349 RepID=UPI002FFDC60A